MIEVWGRASAFNVQKVLWTLGELGLEFRRIEAGGAAGGLADPQFLSLNPHGRIPVLRDGATVVWESHSIVRYLAAAYGAGSLWPLDAAERSLADRWMDWMLATLQPDFMALFWSYYRTPEAERDARAIEAATARCAAGFTILDAHLGCQPYLAGPALTMGDIPAATALYRYFEMGLAQPPLPHARAWYARLAERPAYREYVMQPFAQLRGRLEY
jgi:glutathione S-transferase